MRHALAVCLGLCLAFALFAGLPTFADSADQTTEPPALELEDFELEFEDPAQEELVDLFEDGCPPDLAAMCDPSCSCAHTATTVFCHGSGSACGVSYPNPYCD